MPVTELSDEEWEELVNPPSKEKVNEDLNNEQGTVDIAVDASKAAKVSGVQLKEGVTGLLDGDKQFTVSPSVKPEQNAHIK